MANRSFFPVMHSAPQPTSQFPYSMLPTQMAYDPNRSVSAHPPQAIPPVNGRAEEFEWIEYLNESGKSYYYNKVTKQATWDKPAKFKPAARPNPAVTVTPNNAIWKEYKNPQGRCYYHNPVTNETTWTKPEGFQNEALAIPEDAQRVQPINNNNIPPGMQNASASMPQLPQTHSSTSTDIDKAMEATLKQLAPPNSTELIPVETTDPVVVKQRAFERFKEMLLDKYQGNKINTNQSWDQAVRYIQHDPRFDLVNKVSEKKRIFNEWKAQQQKDDRDARRLAVRRAKEELEKFLLTSEKCRPSMPYQRADKVFREEERWRAVTESDRKDIYKDAMAMLKKKQEEEQKSQREKCQKLLNDLLDTLPEITYRTTWAQTQRILAANEFYLENDDLKQMDKLDALEVFMEYIRKAEREHAKEREQEEKMRRRESRKGRDAFYNYLGELNKQGIIKANSTWQTLFPKIRNDSRFSSMLANTGSTPLDMFKFFVEDLKSEFAKEKKKIKIILENTGQNVNMETPFEEFEKWIRSEDPEKTISHANLRICFDQLVDKAVSEGKDYVRKPSSGKEKRNEMPPLTLFEQISPRITVRSEWEDYKDKIMAELALSDTDELMAETAFNEYIKALKDSKGDGKDISEGEVSDEDEEEKKEPAETPVSRSRSKSRTRSRSKSVEKEKTKKSKKEKKAKKSKKKKDKKHKSSKYEDISSDEDARPRRRRRSDSDSSDRVKSKKARKEKR